MQSVGEVMSIGRTFRESFQKAFRSLELNLPGLSQKIQEIMILRLNAFDFGY
ncbi:MAG: hypothetical protein Ct9H300mP18_02120 [Candidatus Neomarinimicrobiota bacterium]|nr:MAG: hypothetical protein Ct9H300mP18_02120 [Candidatus Neomarinimicrobiota bacterium]